MNYKTYLLYRLAEFCEKVRHEFQALTGAELLKLLAHFVLLDLALSLTLHLNTGYPFWDSFSLVGGIILMIVGAPIIVFCLDFMYWRSVCVLAIAYVWMIFGRFLEFKVSQASESSHLIPFHDSSIFNLTTMASWQFRWFVVAALVILAIKLFRNESRGY